MGILTPLEKGGGIRESAKLKKHTAERANEIADSSVGIRSCPSVVLSVPFPSASASLARRLDDVWIQGQSSNDVTAGPFTQKGRALPNKGV